MIIYFIFLLVFEYVREVRVLHELYATEDTWASCTRGTCVKLYWYWSNHVRSSCGGLWGGILPCKSHISAVLMKHEFAGIILYFVYLFI